MKTRSLLLLLPLLLFLQLPPGTAAAQTFSIRQWTADTRVFEEKVLQVLEDRYRDQPCLEKTGAYLGDLFGELRTLKSELHARSYLLLRDAILTTAEETQPYNVDLTCTIIDKWPFLRAHLRSKLELIGNVLLILEK